MAFDLIWLANSSEDRVLESGGSLGHILHILYAPYFRGSKQIYGKMTALAGLHCFQLNFEVSKTPFELTNYPYYWR
jgi:hypothetical protein